MDLATWGLAGGVIVLLLGVFVMIGAEVRPITRWRRRKPGA